MAPAVKSLVDIRRIVYGITDDEREKMLSSVLSLSTGDIEEARKRFCSAVRNSRIVTITSRENVSSSGLDFDGLSLPS